MLSHLESGPRGRLVTTVVLIVVCIARSAQSNLCGTAENNCHRDAYCTDTVDSFYCTCSRGFLGDGLECEDNGWAVRASFAVGKDAKFPATFSRDTTLQYTAALLTGSFRTQGESVRTAAQSTVLLSSFDESAKISTITLFGVFAQSDDAQLARTTIAKGSRYADFLSFLSSDVLGAAVEIVDYPQVHEWGAATIPSKLQVESARFQESCGILGCWIVDLIVSNPVVATSRPVNVLYFPRTAAEDTSIPSSFNVEAFPCRDNIASMSDTFKMQSTVCCLPTFVQQYTPMDSFASWVADFDLVGKCVEDTPKSIVISSLDRSILGPISGLENSFVSFRGPYALEGSVAGFRIQYDAAELMANAAVTSTLDSQTRMHTFIGLAEFTPTGIESLVPSTKQYRLLLDTSGDFAASSHGSALHEMVQFTHASINQVKDRFGGNGRQVQYVSLRLQLSDGANTHGTKPLIDVSSALVGLSREVYAPKWAAICNEEYDQEVRPILEEVLAQECAPDLTMCSVTESSKADSGDGSQDSLHVLNIPLQRGMLYPLPGDEQLALHLRLPVTVLDSRDREVQSMVEVSIPVSDDRLVSHCSTNEAPSDLRSVSVVEFYAGNIQETPTSWTKTTSAWAQFLDQREKFELQIKTTLSDAKDQTAGLVTLSVQGLDTVWQQADHDRSNVELVDLVAVHVMQVGGRSSFESIVEHINSAHGFTLNSAEEPTQLVPSGPLANLCGSGTQLASSDDVFPYRCYIRRETESQTVQGLPSRTMLDVGAGHWEAVAEFAAGFSDKAATVQASPTSWQNLALQQSQLFTENGKYNRLFWVNPGYAWRPPQDGLPTLFSLSSHVILVGLLKFTVQTPEEGDLPMLSCQEQGSKTKCLTVIWSPDQAVSLSNAMQTCSDRGGDLAWLSHPEEASRVADMSTELAPELWVGYDDSRSGGTQQLELFQLDAEWMIANQQSFSPPSAVSNETLSTCGMLVPITASLDVELTCDQGKLPFVCLFVDSGSPDPAERPECFQWSSGSEVACFEHHADPVTYEEAQQACADLHNEGALALGAEGTTEQAHSALLAALATAIDDPRDSALWIGEYEPAQATASSWTSRGSYSVLGGWRMQWQATWAGEAGAHAVEAECAIAGAAASFAVEGARCGGRRGYVCSFDWDVTQEASFNRDDVEIYAGRRGAAGGGSGRRSGGSAQYAVFGSAAAYAVDGKDLVAEAVGSEAEQAELFTIAMLADRDSACGAPAEFRKQMRGTVLGYLQDAAGQAVLDLQITSFAVGGGCSRRTGSATVTLETVVVLEDPAQSIITQELTSKPNLVSIRKGLPDQEGSGGGGGGGGGDDGGYSGSSQEAEEDGGPNIALIAGAAAGGAVLLLGGALWAYWSLECCGSKASYGGNQRDCTIDMGYLSSPRGQGAFGELAAALPASLQEEIASSSGVKGGGMSQLERNSLQGRDALARERNSVSTTWSSNHRGARGSIASQLSDRDRLKEDLIGALPADTILQLHDDEDAVLNR